MHMTNLTPYILTGLICFIPYAAAAEEIPETRPAQTKGWVFAVGAGALYTLNYFGDDEYSLSAVPYIRITKGERFVASVQEGVKYSWINNENFRAGPRASLDFGRDDDGSGPFRILGDKTEDLIGLEEVGTSISLGGFAEMDFGKFTASANIEQAVSGHEGLTGDASFTYNTVIQRRGPPMIIRFGPQIDFGDKTYQNAFFGIDAQSSLNSGLETFSASGGLVSYGMSGTVIMPLTRNVTGTVFANYSRLDGDAADSPLVRERGSADQGSMGLAIAYSFN